MPRSTDCPKCQGKTTGGVIVDNGHRAATVSQWQSGRDHVAFGWAQNPRKGADPGFLEIYARPV